MSRPGCALARATSSLTLFAGTALCTTSMVGDTVTCETGAKSFTGSYGSLYRLGLMASCDWLRQSQRVAIRRCFRDAVCCDIAGGAGNVVDYERAFPTPRRIFGRAGARRCPDCCRAEAGRRCGLAFRGKSGRWQARAGDTRARAQPRRGPCPSLRLRIGPCERRTISATFWLSPVWRG